MILLFISTAVSSCDAGLKDSHSEDSCGIEHAITVTGTASDKETGLPVAQIRIIIQASENGMDADNKPRETTYTNLDGQFSITMSGFRNPTAFKITAEDPNGIYDSATHEIPLITWNYDYSTSGGTFYLNKCDFHLSHATASESSPQF